MNSCPICKKKDNLKLIDEYKLNILSDKVFFGEPKIFFCSDCNFSFCNPMPEDSNLNKFYNDTYRAKGRPHEIINQNIENELFSNKNLNYLQYLTTFVDMSEVKNIFDFGAGTGDLGFLLKKQFKNINLFCCEKDQNTKKILHERGYKNYKNLEEIKEKFDLIISLHCLEHLKDLEVLKFFKLISNTNSYFFFEVPNNDFDKSFLNRPYDSPHLMFFTKKSIYKISQIFDYKIINISLNSIELSDAFQFFKESKSKYENWSSIQNFNIFSFIFLKKILKKLLPNFFYKIYQSFKFKNRDEILNEFILNKQNAWCLRGIMKIK